jgi:hypothetical protein
MNDPFLNLSDFSHNVALHCNRAYFKYVLSCLKTEAHLLNCIFGAAQPEQPLPILIKQKLALTAAAAKHKYSHPDYSSDDLDQYINWVIWDVDDGGAYVWLSSILDGLALQGVYLHHVSGSADENECLHIKSDLDALIMASDGELKMPATINNKDQELLNYVSSLFERLPHPLGEKKPAF